jgi:hypothetical protein
MDTVFVHVDDTLIASESVEQHLLHLALFLPMSWNRPLMLHSARSLAPLSFFSIATLSPAGLAPVADHVAAVHDFPVLSDLKLLQ